MTEHGGGYDTQRPEIPSSAGWATFEARVRGRRFARCIERAHAAIDSGDLDEARNAVVEAGQLMPGAPEIAELEARIAARPNAAEILPSFAEMPPLEADPGWPRVLGAMAVLLLLFGLFGFGLAQLYFTRPAQELLSAGSSPLDNELTAVKDRSTAAPKPADAPEVAGMPTTPAGKPGGRDNAAATTGMAPAASGATAPRAVTPTAQPRPETPQASIGQPSGSSAERQTRSPRTTPAAPQSRASTRSEVSRPMRPLVEQGPALPPPSSRSVERTTSMTEPTPPPPVAALPSPPAPEPPATATTDASMKPLDVPVQASRETAASNPKADESSRIRSVLYRYESAYNRLDATAASSLYPGVDEAALDRAFKGLLSQRVSLGLCDITVIGDIGGASCAGKARWEPRVGGGVQTADRHWTFNLRKSGDAWKIEQIRVR
jgi:hypothetical protein